MHFKIVWIFIIVYLGPICAQIDEGEDRPFTLKLERGNVDECNKKYMAHCNMKIYKYNRTSPYVLNIDFESLSEWSQDVSVKMDSYEWKDNQFKQSFISLEKNICDFVENDDWLMPMIVDYSNVARSCPIPAGPFTIMNMNGDEKYFPVNFPVSKWKFIFKIIDKNSAEIMIRLNVEFILEAKSKPITTRKYGKA